MGSTNFLQWNPAQQNQESDSAYLSDPQRVGGAPNGTPFPSVTSNKLFYQVSTGITALMQMMSNKGFTVDDTNISTLAATLAAIQTTADSRNPVQVITGASGTINLNAAGFSAFQFFLVGNVTLTISGQTPGQVIPMLFLEPGGGGCTVTFTAAVGEVYLDTTPNAQSTMFFFVANDNSLRAICPGMSGSGINATPIGQSIAANGTFATLIATVATLGALAVTANASVGGDLSVVGSVSGIVHYAGEGGQFSGFTFTGDNATGLFSNAPGTIQLLAANSAVVSITSTTIAINVAATFGNNIIVNGTATFNGASGFNAACNINAGGNFAGSFAGNSTLTGNHTINGTTTLNGGGSLTGNFGGNPNFTGLPTSTTPGATDNSSRVATTSWVQALFNAMGFAASLGTPGYIRLPSFLGGLTLQWGITGNLGGGSTTVTFPIAFNTLFVINCTGFTGGSADFLYVTAKSTTTFTVHDDGAGAAAMWLAVGL